jgi:uncharacterized membrane protein HdeD (DUF308 family)
MRKNSDEGVVMLNPMSAATLDKSTAEQISKGWWILLLSGLVSVVAGILILTIEWTVADLALFVSILFVVRGAFIATTYPLDGSPRPWNLFVGVLSMMVGIAFLAWPDMSLLTLAIFIGAWIVVTGLFDIAGAVANRHDVKYWFVFLIFGILEVGLGMVMLRRPGLTLVVAITVVGFWALVVGTLQVMAAFEVKDLPAKLKR